MSAQDDYKRHVERLKQKISCHDLAAHLSFKRQGEINNGKATYFAPWGSKNNTTLSLSEAAWYDHAEEHGGSVVDLYMRAHNTDFKEAVKGLSEDFGMPIPKPEADPNAEKRDDPLHAVIARRCLIDPDKALDYLAGRGIDVNVAKRAIAKKTLGYNDWRSPVRAEGEAMHGGPAVAFILTSPANGQVIAVEMRYIEPALNGGIKNGCQGEKRGNAWCSNWDFLQSAKCHTVYIVEGPINALSIESAGLPGCAAIATMGTENVEKIDWRFLRGKRVLICLDHNDKVQTNERSKMFGHRAGLYFAWRLHELLTGCDVSAQLVDQDKWPEGEDVNDLLKSGGMKSLATKLIDVEPWLMPGLNPQPTLHGKSRVWLANHHYRSYVRFRVTADTVAWVTGHKKISNDDGTETDVPTTEEVATFRLAAMSRISIQSPMATMTGDTDASPKTMFAVSVQTARHQNKLLRSVFEDRHLHKIDRWDRFGSILSPSGFKRMVAVMETLTDIGARDAVNLVGLGWRTGKLAVNEGVDCYFSDPEKQCPYTHLVFPRGTKADGREVVRAFSGLYKHNAGLQLLTWALGCHLKAILGFWPHLTLQGRKGSGKTSTGTVLERTIAMTIFSGQSMETAYRITKSVSYTTHPVGWEEISARSQPLIDNAVKVLQECYNYKYTTRGFDDLDYLLCASVMVAGEDTTPLKSLTGKLVRVQLDDKKNLKAPPDLAKFPVRQWLEFLAGQDQMAVRETHARLQAHCIKSSRATEEDDGAHRMIENYAAVLTAWSLLCEFLDLPVTQGDFGRDLLADMNAHIKDSTGDREPWVWIVETILSQIAAREFRFPLDWASIDAPGGDKPCLLIRTSHMIDHIARSPALKGMWDGLPVKSDRVLKQQLQHAGVLLMNDAGEPRVFERTMGADPSLGGHAGRRCSNLVALDLERLREFGMHAVGDASILPTQSTNEVLP